MPGTIVGPGTHGGLVTTVQQALANGGIKKATRGQIRQALERAAPLEGRQLRRTIANAVADSALARFREDVRLRKLCIADGQGRVHGHDYVLEQWALGEAAAPDLVCAR